MIFPDFQLQKTPLDIPVQIAQKTVKKSPFTNGAPLLSRTVRKTLHIPHRQTSSRLVQKIRLRFSAWHAETHETIQPPYPNLLLSLAVLYDASCFSMKMTGTFDLSENTGMLFHFRQFPQENRHAQKRAFFHHRGIFRLLWLVTCTGGRNCFPVIRHPRQTRQHAVRPCRKRRHPRTTLSGNCILLRQRCHAKRWKSGLLGHKGCRKRICGCPIRTGYTVLPWQRCRARSRESGILVPQGCHAKAPRCPICPGCHVQLW